jgi:capsule polysaccharide modification protein KpsS
MVDSGDEFFYKNVIDTSSYDESDDDLLMEAVLLIHKHNVAQIPMYRVPSRDAHRL